MPEVKFKIGGRDYSVACEPGEEDQVKQAAALIDTEAKTLEASAGRVPEARMLLMAGLMLADRTTEIALRIQVAEAENARLKSKVEALESGAAAPASSGDAQAAMALLEATAQKLEALAERR
ncbi:MAG: cell division protein ZapA [Pseudomonadota bacterium]